MLVEECYPMPLSLMHIYLAAGVDLNRVVHLAPKHVGRSCGGIG